MPLFELIETQKFTRVIEIEAKNKQEVLDIYYCDNDKDDEHDQLMDDLNSMSIFDLDAEGLDIKVKEIKTK
jgi:hypothetical protein